MSTFALKSLSMGMAYGKHKKSRSNERLFWCEELLEFFAYFPTQEAGNF